VVADESTGGGLGVALRSKVGPGSRVLFPRAQGAGRALPEALRALGAEVTEVEAYRTVCPEGLAAVLREVFRSAPVDAVTFASPSAVRHVVQAIGGDLMGRLAGGEVTVACIGPTTEAAARTLGLTVAVRAERPTSAELAAALVRHFGPAQE